MSMNDAQYLLELEAKNASQEGGSRRDERTCEDG